METTLTVGLYGYPEAILAADHVDLPLPAERTGQGIVMELARLDPRLRHPLLRPDGTPRRSTRILLNGHVVPLSTPLPEQAQVAVLVALPCDG